MLRAGYFVYIFALKIQKSRFSAAFCRLLERSYLFKQLIARLGGTQDTFHTEFFCCIDIFLRIVDEHALLGVERIPLAKPQVYLRVGLCYVLEAGEHSAVCQ